MDDDPWVSDSLKRVLTFGGHTVEAAPGAEEALALFEPGKFDLVIADYKMPGMQGDELAALLKARAPDQKIIILTGHVEELRSQDKPLAADLVIGKPFALREFLEAINKLLNRAD
ncbi:MAG TPA: response regulator [Candidatus Binatia bacterium]|nr:response regulator [Candidatus Binatia bacterium]